ncbi:MAG: MarC family protein [Acetobacteraceae bacterium]
MTIRCRNQLAVGDVRRQRGAAMDSIFSCGRVWWLLVMAAALLPAAAFAAVAGDGVGQSNLPPGKVFTLLFLMLGPLKILQPFMAMTAGTDRAFRVRLATRATLFSAAGLAVAALLGQRFLENFGVPVPVLTLTGGLVLFLVALQTVLQQFDAPPPKPASEPDLRLAVNPLAFPTIVTPYGIAAIIIFMALAVDDWQAKATVAGVTLVILALDWVCMLFAHVILRWIGTVLQIFAVVLAINQVALGLQIILSALANLGLFVLRAP